MDNGASSYRRFRDNGDVHGLDEIIIEYSDGLILYLTSIVGNIQTAEELTEDTFVLLGTKKPKFKEKSSFKTWLYAIGRNIAVDHLRKYSKKACISLEDAPEMTDDENAVEEAYIRKEQQITIHKAMRKLQPKYQQVLWLIYFEGFSNKEAAKIMNKSLRSLESILYRARKSLKSQLETEGFDYAET
ncbi:MAG: RNA polymerase sigma factor [Ruminococcus sp.]|uniref:RNA polymerase sigma factor n=1 Tax=Ruminococcus sp. TaxID=41978 RepID=UPI0025F64865|nr:RNA polymerase sigma factor [Ruminococcus sp.]MBR5683762.1 RNA polymerase sigma factor [Ruminococcus sp.]